MWMQSSVHQQQDRPWRIIAVCLLVHLTNHPKEGPLFLETFASLRASQSARARRSESLGLQIVVWEQVWHAQPLTLSGEFRLADWSGLQHGLRLVGPESKSHFPGPSHKDLLMKHCLSVCQAADNFAL